jgi:hypothetical protein
MSLGLQVAHLQQAYASDPLTVVFISGGLACLVFLVILLYDTYYRRHRRQQRENKRRAQRRAQLSINSPHR